MPTIPSLSNPFLWMCISIFLVLDIFLTLLARQLVTRSTFQQLGRFLVSASGIFFLFVWTSAMIWAWDWFYAYIFPTWGRYWLPPLFTVGYCLLALVMFWLSQKLPGHPAIIWAILGGVEGLFSHIYAIYGLGAASEPPIMQGSDPFLILIFAIFEKSLYWIVILLVSALLWKLIHPHSIRNRYLLR